MLLWQLLRGRVPMTSDESRRQSIERSEARQRDARRALVISLARLAELEFEWLLSIVPKSFLAVEDGQLDIVRSIERIRTAQATQSKPDLRRRLAWVHDHGDVIGRSEYLEMKESYDDGPQPTGDMEKAIWDLGEIMVREAEACSNRGAAVERLGVRARRNPQATHDWYARALRARHAQALLEDAVGPWEECGRAAATLANFVRRVGLVDEEREHLELWEEATGRASRIAPKRASVHYDRARACARLGDRDAAVAALTRAAAMGYGQATHTAEDPDLASLHGSDAFSEVLVAMRANART